MYFDDFFQAATGHAPYDYQRRLACGPRRTGETETDRLTHGTMSIDTQWLAGLAAPIPLLRSLRPFAAIPRLFAAGERPST